MFPAFTVVVTCKFIANNLGGWTVQRTCYEMRVCPASWSGNKLPLTAKHLMGSAATVNAAELIGISDKVGVIEKR